MSDRELLAKIVAEIDGYGLGKMIGEQLVQEARVVLASTPSPQQDAPSERREFIECEGDDHVRRIQDEVALGYGITCADAQLLLDMLAAPEHP